MTPIHDIIKTSDWESVRDAAERLGVSRQRIHQMVKENKIRAVKFGHRNTMIHRRDIERIMSDRKRKAS